jgi:hypothetical protein
VLVLKYWKQWLWVTKPCTKERYRVVSAVESYGRNIGFLHRSRHFFFQIASQLYSRGWVDSVLDPLLLIKSDSAGNRARTSGSLARNSNHWTTEMVRKAEHYCFIHECNKCPQVPNLDTRWRWFFPSTISSLWLPTHIERLDTGQGLRGLQIAP